ncbi:MAG: aminotransferase class I/II-fold pyridoxal phosphate-dependent enzyme [Dysgonamonadaceae bacterium]|jgi:aspartate/methionine/tyrosine aminotransferase|nr:aminotransferase class I/II-fold pyridoxal phosphate-dependent enzyme [Dysgonamonadaceae bacterium]
MKTIVPAERLNSVSEYYFSRKLKEVAEMNKQGKDVINLGVGGPDQPPPQAAIDVFCKAAGRADMHGYQPYVGIPELRQAFSDWYRRWYRTELNPQTEIQPLIGSKEGILHISLAFLNPGDGVLIPNPGYPTYASVSNLVGAKIIPYDLEAHRGWQPDLEALEKTDLSNVKMMWTNYPNMPTGAPATIELYRRLVAFGKKHQIVICNDNPYSFILNEHPISIMEVEGAKTVCIELNSLSKSHNMPGWRMAMLASNPEFIQWILKVKSNIDSGQFKPMMLAAAEALNVSPAWYAEVNATYRRRRMIAEEIMNLLDCSFDPKQSGLFVWGKIPDHYRDSEALSDKLLYEANVFLTPGLIFGSNGTRYIRISLCCNESRLREAVMRVEELVVSG